MDIRRLHYFCTIVEHGQISKAAKALNMSQPPLSQRLKEIEDELGMALIQRKGKRWWVTEAGRELYRRAKNILRQVESIAEGISYPLGDIMGQVHFGAGFVCTCYLPKIFSELFQAYPLISYTLQVAERPSLEVRMQRGLLDMALVPLPVDAGDYTIVNFCPGEMIAVTPRGLLNKEQRSTLQVEDLENIPLLLPRRQSGGGIYEIVTHAFQSLDLKPYILLETPATPILLRMLRQGIQAMTVLPKSEISPGDEEYFDLYTLDIPGLVSTVALIYPTEGKRSHAAQAVINTITQHFSDAP